MTGKSSIVIGFIVFSAAFVGCGLGSGEAPDNPFDGYSSVDSSAGSGMDTIGLELFAGLYQQIFEPTCANSGCHDGTFEPDFRSISSSYNTLVFHPVIKNDTANSLEFRVQPGSAGQSVLMTRLLTDIDGQSGIMPLYVDPESDWPNRKQEYIAAIEAWIEEGARDMFGNAPSAGNLQPALLGAFALIPGTQDPFSRDAQSGPIIVPASVPQIEIWVAVEDEKVAADQLHSVELLLSEDINDFSNATVHGCQLGGPKTEVGLSGAPVVFMHRTVVNLTAFTSGTNLFFRIRVQEESQSDVSISPSAASLNFIKKYYALAIE